MHLIDRDVIEDREVVCDDDETVVWSGHVSKHLGDHTKCIEIETRVDLVEDDVCWFDEFELEHFQLSSLTPRKPNIQITVEELERDVELFAKWCDKSFEDKRSKGFDKLTLKRSTFSLFVLQVDVVNRSEVFDQFDTFDFGDVLKTQKNALF